MSKNGRPAYDLLREWVASDHPVNHFARNAVNFNREYQANYAESLRRVVGDALYLPDGYRNMCWDMREHRDYPKGYPHEPGAMEWTRDQITREEFSAIEWEKLANDLFPED